MFTIGKYDYVFIHREAAPAGPPVFEWIIAKLWRKKIIYDYDDAIWIPVASENNRLAKYVKWFSKVKAICRMAYKVSAGNQFLADFAKPYCKRVEVVPTVVDTEKEHNRVQMQLTGKPAIGWTGTFSTLKYLEILVPVITRLQEKYAFTFVIIANKDPQLPVKDYRFIQWNKETEINDLLSFHVGVMPLLDGEIEKGKCGFKAIQYMALGIPAVVSPVGVNSVIVENGKNGFTAKDEMEWEQRLEELLKNPEMRKKFGEESRTKIESEYSVIATKQHFLNLFA
ncbi:MAG: glycosyltransferase family 4 protein [Chitinophagaceae bacterium]|nr:glycosyltransferase family 4 protein [Chitinophagaceae bacterium]